MLLAIFLALFGFKLTHCIGIGLYFSGHIGYQDDMSIDKNTAKSATLHRKPHNTT